MRVICNTTPFIALSSINHLKLLQEIYRTVIPQAVVEELSRGGNIFVPDPSQLDWVEVIPNQENTSNTMLFQLDYGERQVVLNGLTLNADLVLIDDLSARNIAEYLGLSVKGTLGVLVEAKRRNIISSFQRLAFQMLEQGIYFSERLIREIADGLGEPFQKSVEMVGKK